jgi:cytochrome P450
LPFLTAVIKEALRLSYGVSLRLARIAPDAELRYGEWRIPKGTSVSMTAVLILQNPEIFPSPREFKPERWLEDTDGGLDKYLVSFSGGDRGVLELFETDISDIEIVGDAFFPEVKKGSKGVRVKISSK